MSVDGRRAWRTACAAALSLVAPLAVPRAALAEAEAFHLTCERRTDPLGIDAARPRLSWWVRSPRRGESQSAYQVAVASSPEALRSGRFDRWDSGKVVGDSTVDVEYAGTPPTAGETLHWKVRAWDRDGAPGPWSEPACWRMGLPRPEDWGGAWIGAGPGAQPHAAVLLRTEFDLDAPVERATAFVCGLGYAELLVNGVRAGDGVLEPGFTDYSKRVQYVAHDVTAALRAGRNALAVTLGGGWFDLATPDLFGFERAPWHAPPRLRLALRMELRGGGVRTVVSDGGWKWSHGETTFDCVRGGETIDHRAAARGWELPGFTGAWPDAAVVEPPAGRMVAMQQPPIRVTGTLQPVAVTMPKPGTWVFDLGTNIAGWARLVTRGPAGTRVRLEFNERLAPDGTVDMRNLASHTRGRFQVDEFVLAGEGDESFEPCFTYHGFRYVQVTGLAQAPGPGTLVGRAVTTDPGVAGGFRSSDARIGALRDAIARTYLANLHGIPTDCPQREKMGWLDDGNACMEFGLLNFGTGTLYRKWVDDMLDAQDACGHVADFVPTCGWGRAGASGAPGEMADPWWGGTIVMAPWKLWRLTGDRRVLEDAWPAMCRYVDWLSSTATDGTIQWGLGDWLDETAGGGGRRVPVAQTSTAAWFGCARIVAQAGEVLGRTADAARYAALAARIRSTFNERFLDRATGLYAPDSQTAQAIPLVLGLAPDGLRPAVADRLAENVATARAGHVSAGIVGIAPLFEALRDAGRDDLAWGMLRKEDAPGWLRMLDEGPGTIWECWDGSYSRNHPTLGSVAAWLHSGPGGIRPETPGFGRFVVSPAIVGDLSEAEAWHDGPHGRIRCAWRRSAGTLELRVTVPANTRATVLLPCGSEAGVREGGRPLREAEGVSVEAPRTGRVAVSVGGGDYRFTMPAP